MDKDLGGMDYEGSQKVFTEEKKREEKEDTYDPEKQRQDAYNELLKQYQDQTAGGQSVWAGKEHLGIFWNLDVANPEAEMEKGDTL